ncbi:hypothetical protein GCM10029992_00120 [Glycomyces albus]
MLEIGDLDNGESYNFTVTAHNAEGAGDTATSPSIVPSADVPGVVENVEATANPDGTVEVVWDEADGEGNDVTGYRVEAVSGAGDRTVVGESDGTELVTAEGDLTYGTMYSFSVTTLAGDAAAEPSEPSDSVTPFNVPDAPTDLLAETASDEAGAIDVSWNAPAHNGREIEKYIVTAGNQTEEVQNAANLRMSGFSDGEQVLVSVTAVNEAGESDPAETTSNTMVQPQVAIGNTSSTTSHMTIDFTYEDGGGDATCKLFRYNATSPEVTETCDGSITIGPHYASTEHSVRVEITNPVGTAASETVTVKTKNINGEVYFGCSSRAPTTATRRTPKEAAQTGSRSTRSPAAPRATTPTPATDTPCSAGPRART